MLKDTPNPDDITSLPHAALGRPLLIGKFDEDVYDYIKCLRQAGGVVYTTIVISAAKGMIEHKNPSLGITKEVWTWEKNGPSLFYYMCKKGLRKPQICQGG